MEFWVIFLLDQKMNIHLIYNHKTMTVLPVLPKLLQFVS